MYFHFPRRHRRVLLFPLGLLALAGLLWLGCVAMRGRVMLLQSPHIIELSMPPKPPSDLIDPRPYLNGGCVWPKENGPDITYSKLAHFRQWATIQFGKSALKDTLATHQLKAVLASYGSKPDWKGNGLRIYFHPDARYSSLIAVLDLMGRYKVGQYFLDVNHAPTALYALTIKSPVCPLVPK